MSVSECVCVYVCMCSIGSLHAHSLRSCSSFSFPVCRVIRLQNVVAKLASFLFGIPAPLYDTMAFTSYKFVRSVLVRVWLLGV